MKRIDLNCDLGESADPDHLAVAERIMAQVSSISIACGFHAGTPELMRRTVRLGLSQRLAIGAHPGFRDPEGQGRRELRLTEAEIETAVAYQIGALVGILALEGGRLAHVKPHGALYNLAAGDGGVAGAVARAVAVVDKRLVVFGLAGSRLIEAARALGLATAEEAFADRAYRADGTLVPRDQPGALVEAEGEVVTRVLRLLEDHVMRTVEGQEIRLRADTICLHGDTLGADRLAAALRLALDKAGWQIRSFSASHDG
jgi:UPF0271 protein